MRNSMRNYMCNYTNHYMTGHSYNCGIQSQCDYKIQWGCRIEVSFWASGTTPYKYNAVCYAYMQSSPAVVRARPATIFILCLHFN